MKTKITVSTFVLIFSLLITTQLKSQNASGNVITRDFPTNDFTGISLSEPMDYTILQGDKNLVRIETDDNFMDKVKISVHNGTLTVDTRSLNGASELKVTIQAKDLKSIDISGASTLKSENTLKLDNLTIDASGAAEVKLDLDVANLESDLSGAANVKLSGIVLNHNIKAGGAADLKALELQTSKAEVELTGASNVKIDVKDKLSGRVSGVSDLKLKSDPAINELDKTGNIDLQDIDSLVGEKNIIIEKDTEIFNDNRDKAEGESDSNDHHRGIFDNGKGNFLFGKTNKTYIHWIGINTGINGYLDNKQKFSPPFGYKFMEPDYGKSWFVDINFLQYGLPIIKNYWYLVTGMGFQFNNYVIQNDHILKPNTEYLEANLDTTVNYKKNKLTDVYFQIPLLFQFDTKKIKKSNTFHLLFGVVGGVRVSSWTKQKYEFNDSKNYRTTYDDFNLAPFRWSAMVKVGYGPVNVFATYQLNQMFKPNHGPQLYPFTVGITLLGF
ncbi:MAG: DUF2807 domain-containing protein [Bacteroidota bacterium]